MKFAVALLSSLLAGANAIELNPDNWDDAVAVKTVFIKFFAGQGFEFQVVHSDAVKWV